MRWERGRRSANIEDRRGMRVGRPVALGGGASVIVLLLMLFFGVPTGDVSDVEVQPYDQPGVGGTGASADPEQERLKDFVSTVLADTEDTWPALLAEEGVRYDEPRLVLFDEAVQSACGIQGSAVGPFYCPIDQKVYLDLAFFRELEQRFGAPGDFAQAYVVAHENGHHEQNLLGISEQVYAARQRASPKRANELSVLQELQADCFAGVWAHNAQKQRQILEPGDIEEGLGAASAVGDDTIQKRARGYVVPESFTHGSAEQRQEWFTRGLEHGTLEACNTFAAARRR